MGMVGSIGCGRFSSAIEAAVVVEKDSSDAKAYMYFVPDAKSL